MSTKARKRVNKAMRERRKLPKQPVSAWHRTMDEVRRQVGFGNFGAETGRDGK